MGRPRSSGSCGPAGSWYSQHGTFGAVAKLLSGQSRLGGQGHVSRYPLQEGAEVCSTCRVRAACALQWVLVLPCVGLSLLAWRSPVVAQLQRGLPTSLVLSASFSPEQDDGFYLLHSLNYFKGFILPRDLADRKQAVGWQIGGMPWTGMGLQTC